MRWHPLILDLFETARAHTPVEIYAGIDCDHWVGITLFGERLCMRVVEGIHPSAVVKAELHPHKPFCIS